MRDKRKLAVKVPCANAAPQIFKNCSSDVLVGTGKFNSVLEVPERLLRIIQKR
jgi:hypothetical protein